MDTLDMFQSRLGKIDKFGCWDLEIISTDSGTKSLSTKFQDECQNCSFHLKLSAPEHQEMKGQVKVTRRTLRKIIHSLMVHAQVLEAYIHLALMYIVDYISPVLPIKELIKKDGNLTTPFKLATGMKPLTRKFYVKGFIPVASLNASK